MAERGKFAKAKGGAGSAPAVDPDHRNGHHKGHGDGGKGRPAATWPMTNKGRLERKFYESELARLDVELNRLQEWIKHAGLKIVVLFEGRDAAGRGGTIKNIS